MANGIGMRVRTLFVVAAVGSSLLGGCAVSTGDVSRWESTEHGPSKLEAVFTNKKYDIELRKSAAMSLIRMAPRQGVRVGTKILFERHTNEEQKEVESAFSRLDPADRAKLIASLAPDLITKMQGNPPVAGADGRVPVDTTIPYKDAAFALISSEKPKLVSDAAIEKALTEAVIKWNQTGFEQRIDNAAQAFGVEQMLQFFKAPAVRTLPGLITPNTYRLDRMAKLIAELGDDDTKARASAAIVAVAKKVDSTEWFDAQRKEIQASNAKAGYNKVTKEQLEKQVQQVQDRKFSEDIFPAMKRVGGRAAVQYLLEVAGDAKRTDDRRKLAFVALEGRIDKSQTDDIAKLFAVANDDKVPDEVRTLAFSRLGELPKEATKEKLYAMFNTKGWKTRYLAAGIVLKSSETKDLPEFLAKLPASSKTTAALTEGLTYGAMIRQMRDAAGTRKVMDDAIKGGSFGARMTALGYFQNGPKAEETAIAPLKADKTAVPACAAADECGWTCAYVASPGKDPEMREVKTLGEVVTICIEPTLH